MFSGPFYLNFLVIYADLVEFIRPVYQLLRFLAVFEVFVVKVVQCLLLAVARVAQFRGALVPVEGHVPVLAKRVLVLVRVSEPLQFALTRQLLLIGLLRRASAEVRAQVRGGSRFLITLRLEFDAHQAVILHGRLRGRNEAVRAERRALRLLCLP